MSNVVRKGGLRLYKSAGNAEELVDAFVPSSDGTILGIGDAVKLGANTSDAIGQGPIAVGVTRAAAGDPIYGVVVGVMFQMVDGTGSLDLSKTYRAASTAMYLKIRPANPHDTYAICDDGNLGSGAASANGKANIGYNANLVVSNADTTTGQSNMQLGGASVATTATLQLKIVGVLDDILNDPTSNNAMYLVHINNCQINSGGTGVLGV